MITILLVDDHDSIIKSLQYIIEKSDDMQVVATATNGIEAVSQISSRCPDIIVMDISMPQMDGLEATQQILVRCPTTRVLILSTYDSPDFIRHALEVGATGYMLKDTVSKDLLDGIREVYNNKRYFSQEVAEIAKKHLVLRDEDVSAH